MIRPDNNYGCGRSVVWELKAFKIAKKNGEACKCLDYTTLIIKMIPNESKEKNLCKCEIKCPHCNKQLAKTAEKLSKKFIEFYGKK